MLCFSTTKRVWVNLKLDYERYYHKESKYVRCIFESQDTKKLYTFLYNPNFLYFTKKVILGYFRNWPILGHFSD